jgi:hypothetical protein
MVGQGVARQQASLSRFIDRYGALALQPTIEEVTLCAF